MYPEADSYGDLWELLSIARPHDPDTYEWLCAVEQTLSDIRLLATVAGIPVRWDRALATVRSHAVKAVESLWLGRTDLAVDAANACVMHLPTPEEVRRVRSAAAACLDTRLTEVAVIEPTVPECRTWAPVAYARYLDSARQWLADHVHEPSDLLIIGIRTSGSYLAPLWTALGATLGAARYVTVRPHDPDIAAHESSRWPWPELESVTGWQPDGVVVVDDAISTAWTMDVSIAKIEEMTSAPAFSVVHEHFRHQATVTRPRISVLANTRPDVAPVASRRADDIHRYFAGATSDVSEGELVLESVERLPEGYWLRYLSAMANVRPSTFETGFTGGASRRYRLTCASPEGPVVLVAKYAGFAAVTRLQLPPLIQSHAGPRIRGISSGYLFYDWLPGTPLELGEAVLDSDLQLMATTVAELSRIPSFVPTTVRLQHLADETWASIRRETDAVPNLDGLVRALNSEVTTRPLPANHGHWHWIRTPDGQLRRLNRDRPKRRARSTDLAEDLAAIAVELALTDAQLTQIRQDYTALTGDCVSDHRLAFAVLRHAARVLREYHFYDAVRQRMPERATRLEEAEPFLWRRSTIVKRALTMFGSLTA